MFPYHFLQLPKKYRYLFVSLFANRFMHDIRYIVLRGVTFLNDIWTKYFCKWSFSTCYLISSLLICCVAFTWPKVSLSFSHWNVKGINKYKAKYKYRMQYTNVVYNKIERSTIRRSAVNITSLASCIQKWWTKRWMQREWAFKQQRQTKDKQKTFQFYDFPFENPFEIKFIAEGKMYVCCIYHTTRCLAGRSILVHIHRWNCAVSMRFTFIQLGLLSCCRFIIFY